MTDIQKGLTRQLDDLMRVQMNRGEFLRYMGVALLGVVGITGLLKNLHHAIPKHAQPIRNLAAGYGHGGYGR